MWNDRLINAMTQVRPGSRAMFQKMMETVDVGKEVSEWEREVGGSSEANAMALSGTMLDRFNEDLYTVLMDKAEGEAVTRLKSRKSGEGVMAYMLIYKWYSSSSGQALSDKTARGMAPPVPKTEADIAEAIEKWEEALRKLRGDGRRV